MVSRMAIHCRHWKNCARTCSRLKKSSCEKRPAKQSARRATSAIPISPIPPKLIGFCPCWQFTGQQQFRWSDDLRRRTDHFFIFATGGANDTVGRLELIQEGTPFAHEPLGNTGNRVREYAVRLLECQSRLSEFSGSEPFTIGLVPSQLPACRRDTASILQKRESRA